MKKLAVLFVLMFSALSAVQASAGVFNGAADNGTDALGYYYIITGGIFTNGQTVNGDRASGGVFSFITDDPSWPGSYAIDTWHKDDWFASNAGFALTMRSPGGAIVYDNNGIETNSYGDYYNASGSTGLAGLYRGYSMSNNWDWIYAGYFKLTQATTVKELVGYFDANGGSADPYPFNPNSPSIRYRMNIWSNDGQNLLPVNTGSFAGDVFTSDAISGTFAASDTGVVRVMPDLSTDPIYRLSYTLNDAITLQPGEYWFSHDATVVPIPGALFLLGPGLAGIAVIRKRFKR